MHDMYSSVLSLHMDMQTESNNEVTLHNIFCVVFERQHVLRVCLKVLEKWRYVIKSGITWRTIIFRCFPGLLIAASVTFVSVL